MSEHAWVLENIATYTAGGLEPPERERFEQHTASCPDCARAVEAARAVDRTLEALFTEARPGPALEDRLIRALRAAPSSHKLWMRLAACAAAVFLLGVLGAGGSELIARGELAFPWTWGSNRLVARNNLKQGALALDETAAMAPEARNGVQMIGATDSSGSMRDVGEAADVLSSELLNSVGYYAPARALGVKGTSSLHTPYDRGVPNGGMGADAIDSYANGQPSLTPSTPAHLPLTNATSKTIAGGEGKPAPATAPSSAQSDTRNRPSDRDRGVAVIQIRGLDKEPVDRVIEEIRKAGEKKDQQGAGKEFASNQTQPLTESGKQADAGRGKDMGGQKPAAPAPAPPTPHKIVIRSGAIEFEITSFDAAVAAITKLVTAIQGGYVDTINSQKLANGKVRGSVVVRVPPEQLDTLILDLRKELGKLGELKGMRVGSEDITKQYTDLESRLRAARTMQERLLQIIKAGKGEIKDLLQAEKELGVWRTRIEELEGELRYYNNLVALSTLTITLYEREMRAPFAVVETERVQMGIEVEDVDRAQRQALAAVAEFKGRVTRSELKQIAPGQLQALLHFEVAPEAAGPLRDRLRQLGTVARLDIDRLQQTEGGSGRPQDGRSKHSDTQFLVSLYNVTDLTPRETVHINLACVDAEGAYRTVLARVQKSAGRVVRSNLNRQPGEQSTGTIQFEVKTAEADALLRDLKETGEMLRLQLTEDPEAQNVTRSKRGFDVQLVGLGLVTPRETLTVKLAARDVPAGYRALQEAIARAGGRVLNAQLSEQDRQNVEGQLSFDVRRADETAIDAALLRAGDVQSRTVTRAQDSDNVLDSKLRFQVALVNVANIPPRETVVLGIEVANVDTTAATFTALVSESHGRTVESHEARERSGRVTAKLVFDVPFASAAGLVAKFLAAGMVRVQQETRNPKVPESNLAIARLDVTLSNAELIVPSDEGLWPQVRKGLSTSFIALSWSLTVVIVGVCFVLPWVLVGYAVYRVVLRLRKRTADVSPAA